MPIARSSSRSSRPRVVSRSKSDYGARLVHEDTVSSFYPPLLPPTLRRHHIDYDGGGSSSRRGGGSDGMEELEDHGSCTSSDGDTTMMLNSTMNTTGGAASEYYARSTFEPRCGDWAGGGGRMNATVGAVPEDYYGDRRRYRARSTGRPLFEGETSMGYGMDYEARGVSFHESLSSHRTKTPSRSARVREALLDILLLGGRSRRREKKERMRASSVAPSPAGGGGAVKGAAPRATSLHAHAAPPPPAPEGTPPPPPQGYERRREVTWLDERRRRRRRSSIERYMRTPSVDTALSPPSTSYYGRENGGVLYGGEWMERQQQQRRWKSGEELRRRWQIGGGGGGRTEEEPRRKKKREVVRIWETPRPQCVRIESMTDGGGRRRMGRKDAFVNSHEWTLSRQVSELHLGIIGTTYSGKTALVHRYLTGAYQTEESPEGGRFKKEVVVDCQSHLLLIRDEGIATPDAQFTLWTDAILFVFAVDAWDTFERLQQLYNHMCDYRSLTEMPVILVGTKDSVSESSPRVVTEEQGKRLASKFGRCAYFETNAAYGTNVEKVFKEACLKMFQSRRLSFGGFRAPTPTEKYATDSRMSSQYGGTTSARGPGGIAYGSGSLGPASSASAAAHHRSVSAVPGGGEQMRSKGGSSSSHPYGHATSSRTTHHHSSAIPFSTAPSSSFASRASQMDPRGVSPSASQKSINSVSNVYSRSSAALYDMNGGLYLPNAALSSISSMSGVANSDTVSASQSTSHLPTPSSTPTTQRKNRRISNIFQRPSKSSSSSDHHYHHNSAAAAGLHGGEESRGRDVGQGRSIPIMQGQLYKRSGGKTALNRGEWKKKFVTLTNDGKLTYHQSIKEYMDNGPGKEVYLGLAAVRLPGRQRPRNSQAASALLEGNENENGLSRTPRESIGGAAAERASGEGTSGGGSDDNHPSTSSTAAAAYQASSTASMTSSQRSAAHVIPMTPQTVASHPKKRRPYSRKTGSGKGAEEDEECFEIVTCDQKRWEFCAASAEDREQWVRAIEGQIDAALQKQTSAPSNQARVLGARAEVTAILSVAGNDACADCSAPRPEWASLNLGTAICMECSGIHRNLGSHISKVRSLKFDEWPVEYLSVMRAIGNAASNALWEGARQADVARPRADATPDEREAFIRAKYVERRFLAPLADGATPIGAQLIGAVLAGDVPLVCALLARATAHDVNTSVSPADRRTLLHLACSSGRVVVVQLLLWNNADLRALDERGRSALWHAQNGDANECAAVLIAAGLPADYGIDRSSEEGRGGGEAGRSNGQQQTASIHDSQVILGSLSTRDYTDSTRRLTSVGGNS